MAFKSALLDSGANCTVICTEVANMIDISTAKKIPGPYHGTTADGTKHRLDYLYKLLFQFMDREELIETLALPQMGVDAVLGMNFWNKYDITTNLNTIELEDVESVSPVSKEHDLTHEQRLRLDEAIFKMPCSVTGTLGKTPIMKHSIDTGDAQPIRKKAYVISPYMEQKVNQEIDRMLQLDVIEPADSAWNNPMVIVKKPNGRIRYCIDARALNEVTKPDAYPLPNINRILSRLGKTKYLSAIDLSDAFWQIELDEKDRPKTAFTVTGRGFFQFKRMPFGLRNSPATLCKVVHTVIGLDLEPKIFPYLDDFIIDTETFDEHVSLIEELAKRLRGAGLTISREKSKFCMRELRFVGYLVDERGIRPDPEKIAPVLDYPVPSTIKKERSFYGMASWYRRFISNFAEITAPITELTRTKNVKSFVWSDAAQTAFDSLKQALTSAPVLSMPILHGAWILETDASDHGMGGCLKQVQGGDEKVIIYYSQKLSAAAQKYSTTERECLAVITFIEKARPYIEGVDTFTVVTDHASLLWLMKRPDPQGRLARWILRLQRYTFNIIHRPGKQMVTADALSRALNLIEIQKPDIEADAEYLEQLTNVQREPEKYKMYRIHDDRLYKRNNSGPLDFNGSWKIVVPMNLRKSVLEECHDSVNAAHGGIFKTLYRLRQDYFWPKIKRDAIAHVRDCEMCKTTKPSNNIQRAFMGKE